MKDKNNQKLPTEAVVSKDRLIRDLRRIGVEDGDHISVALSLSSVGHVEGGPEAVIDALLEAVGPNGTIMMNTYTTGFPISRVSSDYIFDYKSTPTYTGLVPDIFRRRKDSIRSHNPICSVTAIGKLADYIASNHEKSSLYSPYSKLAKINGKCLFIGIGNNLVAVRHEAQYMAGLFDVVLRLNGVRYVDNEGKVKLYIYNGSPCIKKLSILFPTLRKIINLNIDKIGVAYAILAPAKELIGAMTKLLKENPTLTLCDDISCLWCRELERKMNLYQKIEHPKYFQRSHLIRTIIALINNFRMKEYKFLSFQNQKSNNLKNAGKLQRFFQLCRSKIAYFLRISYLTLIDFLHKGSLQ